MAIHTYLIVTIVGLLVVTLAIVAALFWYRPDAASSVSFKDSVPVTEDPVSEDPVPEDDSDTKTENKDADDSPEDSDTKTENKDADDTQQYAGMKRLTVLPSAHPENNDMYGDRMHVCGAYAVVTQRSPGSIHLYENMNHARTIDVRGVTDACVTSDGQWISINGDTVQASSWNVRTNHTRLALSPNGRLVLAHGHQGSSSLLIDTSNGAVLSEVQQSNVLWITDARFLAGTRVYGVDGRRDLGVQELPEYDSYHAVDESHMLGVTEGRIDLIRIGPTTEVIDAYPGAETGGRDPVYGTSGLHYNPDAKTLAVTGSRGVHLYTWHKADRAFYAQGVLKSESPSFGHSVVVLDKQSTMVSAPKMCVVTLCYWPDV